VNSVHLVFVAQSVYTTVMNLGLSCRTLRSLNQLKLSFSDVIIVFASHTTPWSTSSTLKTFWRENVSPIYFYQCPIKRIHLISYFENHKNYDQNQIPMENELS